MIADVDQMRLVGQRTVIDAQQHQQGDEAEHDAIDLRLDDAASTRPWRCRSARGRRRRGSTPRSAAPSRRDGKAVVRTRRSVRPWCRRARAGSRDDRRRSSIGGQIGIRLGRGGGAGTGAGGQCRKRQPVLLRKVRLDDVLGDRGAEVSVLVVFAEDHARQSRGCPSARRTRTSRDRAGRDRVPRAACRPSIEITCAVPVLPATSRPGMRARPPVPVGVHHHPEAVVQRGQRRRA